MSNRETPTSEVKRLNSVFVGGLFFQPVCLCSRGEGKTSVNSAALVKTIQNKYSPSLVVVLRARPLASDNDIN